MKFYSAPVRRLRTFNCSPTKINYGHLYVKSDKKGGFSNKFEMAGASNVVSIDTVLGDEPIVVTPSSFEAWHGITMGF